MISLSQRIYQAIAVEAITFVVVKDADVDVVAATAAFQTINTTQK